MLSEFAEQHNDTGCRERNDEVQHRSDGALREHELPRLDIRHTLQPSSRRITFCGTSPAAQTSDVSSSVFPMKQYSASRFTSE